MAIEDIVNENIDQFRCFWLDLENKLKYIDLFKRGITSGDTLGLFFIKDSKAVLELTRYYKDFKKIVIYDVKGTINLLKDYDSIDEFNDPRVEYVYVGQNLPMKFDKIIMNPPYNLGNKITEAVLSSLNDNGDCICLMPLSQYKRKDLYRHVDLFELADPKLFQDASVTKNLCICSLKRETADKYNWDSLLFNSFDNRYKEFYRWNINHNIGLSWKGANYKKPEDFDIETDFIDCSRWVNEMKGSGYHPKSGFGYAYNVIGSGYINKWGSDLAYLRLSSKLAKTNFSKYAYNYSSNKRDCLASKVAAGLFVAHANEEVYMLVPQIDWENISNNPLWQAGNYDDAVLNEMGLKWNADKTVIIKDE